MLKRKSPGFFRGFSFLAYWKGYFLLSSSFTSSYSTSVTSSAEPPDAWPAPPSACCPEAASCEALYNSSDAAFQAFCNSRSEEHTSELQSRENLVCRLLLEK